MEENNENEEKNEEPIDEIKEKSLKEDQVVSSDSSVSKIDLPKEKTNYEELYNKNYKKLLIIPLIILLISIAYLFQFQNQHGDILLKDITLSGGTSIQVNTQADINEIRTILEENFEEISVRSISDTLSGKQLVVVVETTAEVDEIRPFLEEYFGFKLDETNSTIEFTGSSLSDSFYNQLRFALILSFILMAITVFVIFRSFTPSIAVVFAALGDIVMTLALVNLLGMKLSTAGIVAFLMLIGYSVDTDILLTTRVIKRKEGTVNERIWSSFKTGMTMTLTSLLVVIIGYFLTAGFSKVFSQIFTILIIGLLFDIMNTWLFNASIIKYYAEKK
jgi:preprotein translocase subunit SecF